MNPRHSPRPRPKAVFVSPVCGKAKEKKPNFFCKERLWVYNYVMKTTKIIQQDYTSSILNYQFKLPLEMEVLIEDNDPVSPRQVFKIVIYATMNHIYSNRDIETACKRDINFMYLLEGRPAPDHATIARFLSMHFSQCSKKTLAEITEVLLNIGEISGVQVFIDGTKMESAADRYTFVWKKAVTKFQNRLAERSAVFVEGLELSYGIRGNFINLFPYYIYLSS